MGEETNILIDVLGKKIDHMFRKLEKYQTSSTSISSCNQNQVNNAQFAKDRTCHRDLLRAFSRQLTDLDTMKAAIILHPFYPRLLATYIKSHGVFSQPVIVSGIVEVTIDDLNVSQ